MEEEINKNLVIYTPYCLRCEKKFDLTNKSTKHHCIPISLKPKSNVVILLCADCHNELNNLYITQVPKTKLKRKLNPLKVKLEGIKSKLNKTLTRIDDISKEMEGIKDE